MRRGWSWTGGLLLALAAGLSGCVGLGGEVHLAPFYTRLASAEGRIDMEALGGLYHHERETRPDGRGGKVLRRTIGPFYGYDDLGDGNWRSVLLPPLGATSKVGDRQRSYLFPLYMWQGDGREDGGTDWSLISLPGLLMRRTAKEGFEVGLFPLAGRFEDFVTYDRLIFMAWPLFFYTERGETRAYQLIWPFFGWTSGDGLDGLRVWPFYSRADHEGRYRRRFYLWPFFHVQENFVGEGEVKETVRWFFPFWGRTKRGDYTADTWLWPLFGWSRSAEEDFWALDFPWPLVRIQRGPDDVKRTRFWPIYGRLEADGLVETQFLWLLIRLRHEDYLDSERDGVYVIPFWQSTTRTDKETGEVSKWRKAFPLYRFESDDEGESGAFLCLDPFQRNEVIDRHYGWLYKLWEWRQRGPVRRERALWGLWRRERDAGEDRRSLTGLWARRSYHAGGKKVRETSLLFGLLRWRSTEDEGTDLLRPAFPGPGWPGKREPPQGISPSPRR